MIFYLKTQGGWRETQEVTHSSADGGPIPFTAIRLVPLVADYGAASRRSGLLLDAEAIEQDPGLARSEGDPAAEGSRS